MALSFSVGPICYMLKLPCAFRRAPSIDICPLYLTDRLDKIIFVLFSRNFGVSDEVFSGQKFSDLLISSFLVGVNIIM